MSHMCALRAGRYPLRMLFMILATLAALACAANDNVPRPIFEPIFAGTSTPTVTGGQAAAFSVGSGAPAAEDTTYTITTDHPELFVNMPAGVLVPQGCLSAGWSATTTSVTEAVTVTITMSRPDGATSICTVTICP